MSPLDPLRGAYVVAPSWVRAAASHVLALAPTRALYGKTYRTWRESIASGRSDPNFAGLFARQALAEVLTSALQQSSFYTRRVTRRNVSPEEALAVLSEFPVLTKEDVRDNAAEIAIVPLDRLSCVTTSGSSGSPLRVWLDRDRGVREQAFIHEVWARAGFRPGDARGVFRGVHIDHVDARPLQWEAALRELRCSPFHLTDEHMGRYAHELERRNIRYLHGYPSALAIFGSYLQRANEAWRERVRGVFPISEPMYVDQWPRLSAAFPNAKLLPFYGLSEKVAFGEPAERPHGQYAMNPLYGWAELVDDEGKPLTDRGARGRLVSTGFLSRGMPLIRYDTGDVAELVAPALPENCWRLTVTGLTGRWQPEFLVSNAGALLSMTALNIHSPNYLSMVEFMFEQSEPGRATLRAVPAPCADRAAIEAYLDELRAKVGSGVEFELRIVETLPAGARGKRRFIDQKLDLSHFGA